MHLAHALVMSKMRLFQRMLTLLVFLLIIPGCALADTLTDIRAKANDGDYDVALNMAHRMLKKTPDDEQRYDLLFFIFETEYLRASLHEFDDIQPVEEAFAAILREFPERIDREAWLWKMAWIEWKAEKQKRAIETAAELLRRYPSGPYARDAILLIARIYLERDEPEAAERYVLKAVLLGGKTPDQKVQIEVFEALVNARRNPGKAFEYAQKAWADGKQIVEKDPFLFYAVIRIWARNGHAKDVLQKVEDFLSLYVEEDEVPYVNLIYGDVLHRLGMNKKAQFVYAVLAERHPDMPLGKKAFLRGLMVEYADVNEESRLIPVLRSIYRVEKDNQLTDIEIEAALDQAILYARLAQKDKRYMLPALMHFALVAESDVAPFRDIGRTKGRDAFLSSLEYYIGNGSNVQAITIWKKFGLFRTGSSRELQVATGVALAYADMGLLGQAEDLLKSVEQKSSGSLWADRNFLERARIWLKRNDADGVNKIMSWLAQHESTIYRPELLITAARMYVGRGDAAQAFQVLKQVKVLSLDEETRLEYWMTQAELSADLEQWNRAAEAWSRVLKLAKTDEVRNHALYEQATVWLKGGEYVNAVRLYEAIPEVSRDDAWIYHSAVAQMYAGEVRSAEAKLRSLVEKKSSSRYALLARLELAEHVAKRLKEYRP